LLVNLSCLAAVVAAVWWRIAATRTASPGRRVAVTFATMAVAAGVLVWMVSEPLQPGWARKAGTPSALLAAAPATSTSSPLPTSFDSPLEGTIADSQAGSSRAEVTINARLTAVPARLHVVIDGTALSNGGVAMDGSSVRLGTGDATTSYRGQVMSLEGQDLVASLQDAAGHPIVLTIHLVDAGASSVSGTVTARPGG
jgi:hypothetical protein